MENRDKLLEEFITELHKIPHLNLPLNQEQMIAEHFIDESYRRTEKEESLGNEFVIKQKLYYSNEEFLDDMMQCAENIKESTIKDFSESLLTSLENTLNDKEANYEDAIFSASDIAFVVYETKKDFGYDAEETYEGH